MFAILEIIEGSLKGAKYKVEPGTIIGRSSGDIRIPDTKASARHAIIQEDEKGQLVVMDLDSSNGIIVNMRRVKKVTLIPGVSFKIGLHVFRVPQAHEQLLDDSNIILTWRNLLSEELKKVSAENIDVALNAFPRLIKLSFISGPQSGVQWVLGYGPRWVGADSMDCELIGPDAPDLGFALQSETNSLAVQIICKAAGKILLNNQTFQQQYLQEGDIISFGKTRIQVSYV
ncbi:MAG: FHA domain-containing protein [Pseudobdellovibrionaceae bacterium]